MPFLAFCWLIIESRIIPDGFQKWVVLSFYIHPIFLCFCQTVLWIKLIQRWCFHLILFLSRLILCVSSCCTTILRDLKSRALFFASSTRAAAITHVLDEEALVENELPQTTCSQNQLVLFAPYRNTLHVETYYEVGSILEVLREKDEVSVDENPNLIQHDDYSDCSTSTTSSAEVEPNPDGEDNISSAESLDMYPPVSYPSSSNLTLLELGLHSNEFLSPICSTHSTVKSDMIARSVEEELDSVYIKYEERMKWFDVLNHDRVHGIDALQKMNLARPGLLESMVPADSFVSSSSWIEKAREKLLKSLRNDFKLVYVAQSCLSWDALHHQYRKVEAIANSSQNGVLHKDTAEIFQQFHILLQRFIEDEHITGQRYSNYVQRRFSVKKLLQVPQVLGVAFLPENDRTAEDVMNVKASQVLKIIDNCIKVFWLFVKADTKKSTWKLKNILYSNSPVEDPRDLELLYDLRKILRRKELLLKNLEGKRECWWKKAVNREVQMDYQRVDDFLFTMIDLKLVKNVLQMLTISTSQLKWCQKKLTNIDIRQRKIYRTQHTHLFPSGS